MFNLCYTPTRLGGLELEVTRHADWSLFDRLAEMICTEFDARIVERLDGLDVRYWDLEAGDQKVTLHLHDMVGISLFLEPGVDESLLRRIGAFLEIRPR